MRIAFLATLILAVGEAMAEGAVILVGAHDLQPNMANQSVFIDGSGSEPVTGFNLFAQIGDGAGGVAAPVFQAVDFSGGVWDAYPFTPTGGPLIGAETRAEASVVFNSTGQSVSPNGRIVRLLIDTTGIFGGTYDLKLSGTLAGIDSHYLGTEGAEIPIEITNGRLNVVPEPSSLMILLLSGLGTAFGTSWARRRRLARSTATSPL